MATVTVTLAASNKTLPIFYAPYGDYPVCNVYQVAISLTADDLSVFHHGKQVGIEGPTFDLPNSIPWNFPPYSVTAPSGGRAISPSFTARSGTYDDGKLYAFKLTGTPGATTLFGNTGTELVVGPGTASSADTATINLRDIPAGSKTGRPIWTFVRSAGPLSYTGNAYGRSGLALDVYCFFINFDDPWESDDANGYTIGINHPTLNAIFEDGHSVAGVQLRLYNYLFGAALTFQNEIRPTLKPSAHADMALNSALRPGYYRPPIFSELDHLQPWSCQMLKCTGSTIDTQRVLSPCATTFMDVLDGGSKVGSSWLEGGSGASIPPIDGIFNFNYTQTGVTPGGAAIWVTSGATYKISLFTLNLGYASYAWRVYFKNVFGKTLNPGGTLLTGNVAPYSYLYAGSFTAPATAVKAGFVAYGISGGVEDTTPRRIESFHYNTSIIPPHYAPQMGDFVPGNYYGATLGDSDHP